MKKPYAIPIPLIAALALAAVPAAASATVTITKDGAELATGAEIKGVSANLNFEVSSEEKIECSSSKVVGTVTANNAEPATARITEASFKGTSGSDEECASFLGAVEITPEHLPWKLSLSSNKTGELTSEAAEEPIAFLAVFTADMDKTCEYERSSGVAEAFKTEVSPLTLTVAKTQTFERVGGASTGCPKEGTLSRAMFEVTSEGVELEATT